VLVGSKWYGSNETDDYLRQVQLMTKELKGPVVFTGFLPPSEVPRYYNMGDIFVCASQWREPLARVHYEAMGAGLPIITTDRGGNTEVIQENMNGLIIKDYNNPEAFAKNISYLIENEDISIEMGKNGREIAEKNYNWNRVANQLLEAFATV
jgi:spore coat protein SA